jgi:hypothetical protein
MDEKGYNTLIPHLRVGPQMRGASGGGLELELDKGCVGIRAEGDILPSNNRDTGGIVKVNL